MRSAEAEVMIVRQSIAEADERAKYAGPGWWRMTPAELTAAKIRFDNERRLRDEQIAAEELAIEIEIVRLRLRRPDEKIVVVDGIVRMADTLSLVFGYPKVWSRIG